MLFNQNAYSQFGSNYSPNGGAMGAGTPSPEDGYSGARTAQAQRPYAPQIPGAMGYGQPSQSASAGQAPQKPVPGVPGAPTPQAQPPALTSALPTSGMTWSQMQSQGYARPPFPSVASSGPNPSVPPGVQYPMSASGPNPSVQPGVEYPVAGQSAGGTVGAPPTLEQQLTQAYQGYQGLPSFQNPSSGSAIDSGTQGAVQSLLSNPSPYLSQAYQSQLQQTMGQIDDQYNQSDLALHQNIASRGLDTAGTIGASDQRYNNLLRRSAQTDAATNLLNQLAQSYSTDRANAVNAGMGYGAQQFGQAQGTYATNQGANAQDFAQKNAALQNLLGYGQQSFNNQLQTSQFNAGQDQQNTALLLQLLGAGY